MILRLSGRTTSPENPAMNTRMASLRPSASRRAHRRGGRSSAGHEAGTSRFHVSRAISRSPGTDQQQPTFQDTAIAPAPTQAAPSPAGSAAARAAENAVASRRAPTPRTWHKLRLPRRSSRPSPAPIAAAPPRRPQLQGVDRRGSAARAHQPARRCARASLNRRQVRRDAECAAHRHERRRDSRGIHRGVRSRIGVSRHGRGQRHDRFSR